MLRNAGSAFEGEDVGRRCRRPAAPGPRARVFALAALALLTLPSCGPGAVTLVDDGPQLTDTQPEAGGDTATDTATDDTGHTDTATDDTGPGPDDTASGGDTGGGEDSADPETAWVGSWALAWDWPEWGAGGECSGALEALEDGSRLVADVGCASETLGAVVGRLVVDQVNGGAELELSSERDPDGADVDLDTATTDGQLQVSGAQRTELLGGVCNVSFSAELAEVAL